MTRINEPRRGLLRWTLLVFAAMLLAIPVKAAAFSTIYAFGDSLTDAGNVWKATLRTEPLSPPYSQGRFSNGPVWVQDLGVALGINTIKPSLLGGTDYAYGGAESGPTSVHDISPLDLPAQLVQFKANVAHPKSDALFVLWIGANDLFDMLSKNLTASQTSHAISDVMRNEEAFVTAIALLGTTHLMVLTVPDLGVTPDITSEGATAAKAATALSAQFNETLTSRMQILALLYGLDLTIVDTMSLIDAAVANPAQYGFKNVTKPCWTGSFTSRDGSLCAKGMTAQDRHLFWDKIHPTAAGHSFVDTAAVKALAHPSLLLANAAR